MKRDIYNVKQLIKHAWSLENKLLCQAGISVRYDFPLMYYFGELDECGVFVDDVIPSFRESSRRNRCYDNVESMLQENPDFMIVFGLCLLKCGVWVTHAWVRDCIAHYDSTPLFNEECKLYYGITIDDPLEVGWWRIRTSASDKRSMKPILRYLIEINRIMTAA